MLHSRVGVLASNQTLDIENCVLGVDSTLVLGGIADKPLLVSEGHPGRSDTVTLIVGNNFNLAVLVHAYARVGSAQIDTDGGVDSLLISCNVACQEQSHCQREQSEREAPRHDSGSPKRRSQKLAGSQSQTRELSFLHPNKHRGS